MNILNFKKHLCWLLIILLFSISAALQAATVDGNLTSDTGCPVSYSYVILFSVDTPDSVYRSITNGTLSDINRDFMMETNGDVNGHYIFTNVPIGEYYVYAMAPGYVPAFYVGSTPVGQIEVVEVDADDQEIVGINIQLVVDSSQNNNGVISGHVYRMDNTPVANVFIGLVTDTNPTVLVDWFLSQSDSNGHYIVTGIPAGTYKAAVYDYYTLVPAALSQTFTIAANQQISDINIYLGNDFHYCYTVSGNITDTSGNPAVNSFVKISGMGEVNGGTGTMYIQEYAFVSLSGSFQLLNIPNGVYQISAYGPTTPPVYYPGTLDINQATDVVVNGQNVTGINYSLLAFTSHFVSGQVTDALTQAPLAGVTVSLCEGGFNNHPVNDSTYTNYATMTDVNGYYSIEAPVGYYYAIAYANSNQYEVQYFDQVSNPFEATLILIFNQDETNIDFRLRAPQGNGQYSVTGLVTSNGVPVNYPVMVVAVSSDEDWETAVITDQNGCYSLNNMLPGDYYIMACSPYNPPTYYNNSVDWENADLITVNGNLTGVNFNLSQFIVNGPNCISGSVLGAGNTPMSNVTVCIKDSLQRIISYATTNSTGTYSIYGLPNANVTILATKLGYYTQSEQLFINANHNQNFYLDAATPNVDPVVPVLIDKVSNYPNPFNPLTNISLEVKKDSEVCVEVFNIKGQCIRTLLNQKVKAGNHSIVWNGKDNKNNLVSSGIYLLKLKSDGYVITHKMSMMK